MKTPNRAPRLALFVYAFAAIFVAACSVSTTKGDLAPRVARLESELSRGKSTKADVLLIMGQPDGAGGAALSRLPAPDEIWFFEEFSGGLTAGSRRVLLVYFRGEVLDGYQWFADKFDVHLH